MPININDIRGGRNGIDSPLALLERQCCEAVNVHWAEATCGTRRYGASDFTITGGTAFTASIRSLIHHTPSGNDAERELWAVDNVGLVKRRVPSAAAWADVTLDDAISGDYHKVVGVSLNGKLFLSYTCAGGGANRLHVYDPAVAVVRRVGLAAPGAGTVADTGVGAYANTPRYYRTRLIQKSGAIVVRRSEPTTVSTALPFAPSGAGSGVLITKGTVASERETHWEVEVSPDNLLWFVLFGASNGNEIAIATATATDTVTAAARLLLPVAEGVGQFQLVPNSSYLATDGNRLVMGGNPDPTLSTSRLYYTPVLGTSDHGDDERIIITATLKTYLDLNEKDGGQITGISEPCNGLMYVGKYRNLYKLTPTGEVSAPYLPKRISNTVGIIEHKSIVSMQDAAGNDIVGFMSLRGFYRVGVDGLFYLSRDVEDRWQGKNGFSPVNRDATISVGHGVYFPLLRQVWWWIAVGAEFPNLILVLDCAQSNTRDEYGMRGGWSVYTGLSATAYCSALYTTSIFSNGVSTFASKDLVPYIGGANAGAARVGKCHDSQVNRDFNTAYQAYWTSKGYLPGGDTDTSGTVTEPILTAKAAAAVGIQVTAIRDFGKQPQVGSVLLTAEYSETRVVRRVAESMIADAKVLQYTVGDASALDVNWMLDQLYATIQGELAT